MSILYPRSFTFFNCQLSHLSLRKWRGMRWRSHGVHAPSRRTLLQCAVRATDAGGSRQGILECLLAANDIFEELR